MDHRNDEVLHKRRIGRTYAIASKSVTLAEYQRLAKDRYITEAKYIRDPELPVVGVDWYMAASYCNLLSEAEGLEECYATDAKGQVARLKANYLSLTGYRLPTEAEMEYSTRAGASTSRYYGETEEMLGQHAWYTKNAREMPWPVGLKKPNDLGLFDAEGNCLTWCQEAYSAYPSAEGKAVIEDKEGALAVVGTVSRVLRGGSFIDQASFLRSSNRDNYAPSNRSDNNGFRPSRTLLP